VTGTVQHLPDSVNPDHVAVSRQGSAAAVTAIAEVAIVVLVALPRMARVGLMLAVAVLAVFVAGGGRSRGIPRRAARPLRV
jgi:hypothetical protein